MDTIIAIPTRRISDWDTFHRVFAEIFVFPDYYGKNMDAWVDCMTDVLLDIREETMILRLRDGNSFQKRCPEIYQALIECANDLNTRMREMKKKKMIALISQ